MQRPSSTMLKHCAEHPQASKRAVPQAMPHDAPSNAQTDRQTYKHPITLSSYLTLANARRGAQRFSPNREETSVR